MCVLRVMLSVKCGIWRMQIDRQADRPGIRYNLTTINTVKYLGGREKCKLNLTLFLKHNLFSFNFAL